MSQTEQKREYGEAMALEIMRALGLSPHDLPKLARYARKCFEDGAAEQRRKDAEGQEPVYQVYRGDYYGWFDCKKSEWEEDERDPEHKRVLYAHPANVAALEARIAELEAERDSLRGALIECGLNASALLGPKLVENIPTEVRLKIAALTRDGDQS
ncbi:hypothetical protein HKD21_10215 [Gluconobacter cerevisiae]|uniref:Uncharacterized protein n=1 Tax=Gluconobacter cerevisiae TaxID=1379734 RepID=A0ABR9YFW9_9PROT|nr:hypothetical protein [Gluconobacter cerevisiae]MBF0877219.1 hypothetical protein [Gluconobacter cerevisiae]